MQISLAALIGLLPLAAQSATVTFRIPVSHALTNPHTLPPSTHATLSSPGGRQSAPISAAGEFVFRNVSAGSHLVDVHCATHAFAPIRLDVADDDKDAPTLGAWVTFRGNDWDNKGEALPAHGSGVFDVRVLGAKGYFMERSKFSVMTIMKNPMILLGLVTMGIFLGMPYLVDNMDPEMKAEWDERQKSNPMNSLMGSAGQPGAGVGNFDMAAFLAGSSKKDDESAAASPAGNGGKKKR